MDSSRCPKCHKAIDDHDECPKCNKRHCELDTCPVAMKEAMGPTPEFIPKPCPKCGKPLGTWDSKRKIWRPLPGKRVCPHCHASL